MAVVKEYKFEGSTVRIHDDCLLKDQKKIQEILDEIAKIDPRIDIIWEDCGEFPFSYDTFVSSEENYQETLLFTQKLLKLRGGKGVGFLFKGVMMQDWKKTAGAVPVLMTLIGLRL